MKDRLHELFDYDPDTGDLTRRIGVRGSPKGTVIGTTRPNGYKVAVVDGKPYRVHRLVWMYHHGDIQHEVDHINRDKGDNRIENLRLCTRTENVRNAVGKGPGYKGVSFCKQTGKWVAQITVNYRNKKLGRFITQEDAALAYNTAASEHFGEFAYLNEV